jgi:hypothetical protein
MNIVLPVLSSEEYLSIRTDPAAFASEQSEKESSVAAEVDRYRDRKNPGPTPVTLDVAASTAACEKAGLPAAFAGYLAPLVDPADLEKDAANLRKLIATAIRRGEF